MTELYYDNQYRQISREEWERQRGEWQQARDKAFEESGAPELFAAFLRGFDTSGEGFNGEYVGERYRTPGGFFAKMLSRYRGEDD